MATYVKRPTGKKLYTPAQAWRNDTGGMANQGFVFINALFGVLTESQQVRALEKLGWVAATQQVPEKKGVAAQP